MVLRRRDPFELMPRNTGEMLSRTWRDLMMRDFFNLPNTDTPRIPVDMYYDESDLVIEASVPGVKPEEMHVVIDDNAYTITLRHESERQRDQRQEHYLFRENTYSSFERTVRLPDNVDTSQAHAHYENGVLTIRMPSVQTPTNVRELPVTVHATTESVEPATDVTVEHRD